MRIKTVETAANDRLFQKRLLAAAVTTAMFGSGTALAVAVDISSNTAVSGDRTTNYNVQGKFELEIAGGKTATGYLSSFNGTIDGELGGAWGAGNVIVGGNLTMRGNVGATNNTGNFTVGQFNTLVLDDSMTVFNTSNLSLGGNSTLNFGNATAGYNRLGNVLQMNANITMAGNSTINIGNNVTLNGDISGVSSGVGTVNIVGNFTSGGHIGAHNSSSNKKLMEINISKGNTFTLGAHNASATRMNINGTVTAFGLGNITSSVTIGEGGVLNLTTAGNVTHGTTAPRVTGTIDAYSGTNGTLNVNGTWSTAGVIGGTRALSTINLDNNATSSAHTYTFAHNVNATTINIGTINMSKNATLTIAAGGSTNNEITVTGSIVGGGNSSSTDNAAGGRFWVKGNATVNGNIGTSSGRLADIRIQDGTTLTIKGAGRNIYANNITMNESGRDGAQNSTLSFNGTGTTTVYGEIAGGSTSLGYGLVDVNTGIVSFKGTVGTKTNYVSAVDVADGSTMTTSSNIFANATVKIRGTLNIDSTSGITITATDNQGEGGGLQIGNTSGDNGTLETAGTVVLDSFTKTTATGGATAAFNNATIKLNGTHSSHATSATAYINIGTNNQTLILQGATTIDLDLTNTVSTDGATIVIIGRGSEALSNGTLNVSGNISFTGYQMFDLTVNNSTVGGWSAGYGSDASSKSLNATVDYRSSASLGQTGNTKTVYDASKTAIAADTTVFQALAGMTTDATINAAIKTMSPATAGAAAASAAISGSSVNTANTRMAYMRQTGSGRGMNAGGAAKDESMWLQIFGANIDQDTVSSVSGYDADGQGIALGLDGMSSDGTTRIGVAGSFSKTDVTGKDSTTKTTDDIDTTQVMVYANKDYPDGMYLQGVASYSFNDNKGTRRILVGAVDRTASSSYDSGLFSVSVEAGWPEEDDGVTVTPTVGLTFSSLSTDAYTETGAGNMNLSVTPADVNTVEGKLGVKMTGKTVNADGGVGRPEVRVGLSHNFGDETADSTATFTAGGSTFTTTGVKTDSTKIDVGLGYTYTTPEGDTEISINADGRHSSSYVQYGAGLTVKWKF